MTRCEYGGVEFFDNATLATVESFGVDCSQIVLYSGLGCALLLCLCCLCAGQTCCLRATKRDGTDADGRFSKMTADSFDHERDSIPDSVALMP